MGTPKDQTYVDDHDYQHNPKDQLARRFLILDLGSNGLQRTNTHCGSDDVVGENDPGSEVVYGFHGFAKLLTIADRGHAEGMACCKDSKCFRRLILVLLSSDERWKDKGFPLIGVKKKRETGDEKS